MSLVSAHSSQLANQECCTDFKLMKNREEVESLSLSLSLSLTHTHTHTHILTNRKMKSVLVRFTIVNIQVAEVLMTFFPPVSEPLHQVVRSRFTQRLVELHEACQRSQFFWVRKLIDLNHIRVLLSISIALYSSVL